MRSGLYMVASMGVLKAREGEGVTLLAVTEGDGVWGDNPGVEGGTNTNVMVVRECRGS